MPSSGVKAHGQSAQRRVLSKRVSNNSGISSSNSSAPWSTREARPSASISSSVGTTSRPSKPEHLSLEPPSLRYSSVRTSPKLPSRISHAEHGHRKSRRVESWLKEQQRFCNDMDESAREHIAKAAGTPCNPYLAYPGMSKFASWQDSNDEDDILGSFVIVEEEEEESEDERMGGPSMSDNTYTLQPSVDDIISTSTPSRSNSTQPSSLRASRPASTLSISSWRNRPFTKTLPTQRHPSGSEAPIDLSTPPASLKFGSLRLRSPIPETFLDTDPSTNSRSGKTAQNKASSATLRASETPRTSVRKRLSNLMRPSGNVSAYLQSPTSTKASSSPRPSTSASVTTATTSTAVENEPRCSEDSSPKRFLQKFSINISKAAQQPSDDLRVGSPTFSSFSGAEQHEEPVIGSPFLDSAFSHPQAPFTPVPSHRQTQSGIFGDKRHNASSSALSTLSIGSIGSIATNINGRASSVFTGSSTVKRKRLVVSGIGWDDTAAVEGLRRWCERFGELRQVTRMPNGDFLIDFKRADVADTVCRISARVHIDGVGSVNMSWTTGKRH